jgi:hypothetical protein
MCNLKQKTFMKRILVLFMICLSLLITAFIPSSKDKEVLSFEDPVLMAQRICDYMQRKDSLGYAKEFGFTKESFVALLNRAYQDSSVPAESKERIAKMLTDTSEINGLVLETQALVPEALKSFQELNLDPSSIEFLDAFYEIERDVRFPILVQMEDLDIFVKVKQRYFLISLDDFFWESGHWKGGEFKRISEVDPYAQRLQDMESETYLVDTVAAEPAVKNRKSKK